MQFVDLRPGTTVEGDDIPSFRSETKGSKYIYLLAGVHGDEVEGVYVLKKLFEWLKEDDAPQLPLIIIPILNVDGHRMQNRVNSHGVDLNRNLDSNNWSDVSRGPRYFPGTNALSEPENQYLVKLFNKYPPKFILSFHSWKRMLNYNGDCKEVAELLARHNSYPVVADIDGHPTPGSLGEYGPEKHNCPVLTFECPLISDGITLKEVWEENKVAVQTLLKSKLIHP